MEREDAQKWHTLLTAQGLLGKGNVRLLIADNNSFLGPSRAAKSKRGMYPQLIVDLFEEGGV